MEQIDYACQQKKKKKKKKKKKEFFLNGFEAPNIFLS